VLLLIWLILPSRKTLHYFDQRLSFRKSDKIPYGSYVAYNHLEYLFPSAKIGINRTAPDSWKDSVTGDNKQALLIVTPLFFADEYEMRALVDFAKNGNDVFISAKDLSLSAQNYLHCETSSTNFGDQARQKDSMEVKLDMQSNEQSSSFFYPGRRYDSYFFKYDTAVSYEYGSSTNEDGGTQFQLANFIRLKTGEGNIYLHLAPVCFSNYFLLYHDNINYYNQILSVIPADRKKVLWDEYYLHKYAEYSSNADRNNSGSGRNEGDILSGLMSNPSFRAALWLLVIVLALIVLQEIRRKQRFIPEMAPPRNDSLEFVKTIGRLYYEKKDNRNLTRKMSAYFLEHVRNRYKLSTVNLDEKFIKTLYMKSGQPEENIQAIVSFINNSEQAEGVSDKQLTGFHKQLEEFYKNA
jgi:hypothetical protein